MKRRSFLKSGLIGLGALIGGRAAELLPTAMAQDTGESGVLDISGAIMNVHDPVMIKHADYYYLYHTGAGIPMKRSPDMRTWRVARGGTAFFGNPEEVFAWVPGAADIWAPDISYWNGRYHLYYSVSTFGSSRSAIGLATNLSLDFADPNYEWVHHGIVVKSDHDTNWNAIDANLALDADGMPWLVFGSHWSGIKMIRLDYETGLQSTEDDTLYDIAARAESPRAIEAPFIIRKGDYYYLFVSFDQCCNGIHSTYNVRVGRSESITGPYVDRDNVSMMEDGGTQILWSQGRWRGPGHNAIFSEDGSDYIVYHAYDQVQGGTPTLRIATLLWDDEGWPYVPGMGPEA
ncbi:MAG: Intracellular endo-alpha-(1-_5)-L-arabinanase [Anaerolineae bacterium]|nr:MAG: putative endo-1,5-alpha-L-arabinanase [Chloroflexi bacterium OLB13]MBV6435369.1 Intracellular endo-alpha-(1->5)-L-arabinanase [Anaerolineae bacterium]MEB2364916.1 arabinan endo-1,5-alpha-L-arabinosidase [Chloroflexota bacterium]